MSYAKLLTTLCVVAVGGAIAAKLHFKRTQSELTKRTSRMLVEQHPDLLVKIYANKIKRMREDGASEAAIVEVEMLLYEAQERIDQDRCDALDVIVAESRQRTEHATYRLEGFREVIRREEEAAAASGAAESK